MGRRYELRAMEKESALPHEGVLVVWARERVHRIPTVTPKLAFLAFADEA
jgi:hypothetical protein